VKISIVFQLNRGDGAASVHRARAANATLILD
jgi:hypothetical protein